jgi:acetylornithine deacetylase/succinyl-diaminopimelate desuccinylase family protein
LSSVAPSIVGKLLAEIHEEEIVNFLRQLIQLPTVNPPGDVHAATAIVQSKLAENGFETRTVGIDDARPNLIATLGSERPILCFNAHLDVVPPGELGAWTHPPFEAAVVDGRVYGRGAGDDKASVTAQVLAGVALARSRIPLKGQLVITEVADEEMGGPAGTALLINERHVDPDWVIVGEQTLNTVAIGEKGLAGMRVIVSGKTSHAALPAEGSNAIEGMALVIAAIRRELWPKIAARSYPTFLPSSGAITKITGGVRENVVPDRCEIYLDRRVIPGEDPIAVRDEVLAIARNAVLEIDGLSVAAELDAEFCPASASDPESPHVRAMVVANRHLGLSEELTGFNMATDGRYFSRAGHPTIIYGPGNPRLAHVANEWVGIDEVVNATKAYALTALQLLGDGIE